MTSRFDLVAIGTGSAASTVASRCRAAGWSVAIVDKRPFGGTCALRGCDPKKVLVGAADAVTWARHLTGKGVDSAGLRIDWPGLMRFKRTFTEPVPEARQRNFEKEGIAAFHGTARFTGPTSLEVGQDVLESRYVVIATGMIPAPLGIPGAELAVTSDVFLDLDELPRRIVFIGGGYISCEFANVAAAAGADVTIVHRGSQLLNGFDRDLVRQLTSGMREAGIRVVLNVRADAIERRDSELRLLASENGQGRVFDSAMIVHGAGRVPDLDDLNLQAAGVIAGKRGVTVNEYLQSVSNPAVYSAGDAAASGNPPLTPLAGYEAGVVADNLLKGNHRKADAGVVPTVAFTIPPIASVGMNEEKARSAGLRFRVNFQDTSGWYESRRIAEPHSGFKVLVEEETDRVLGAHLLGHHAEEIINIFTMAIRSDMRASQLKEMIFAYPASASNIRYMLA